MSITRNALSLLFAMPAIGFFIWVLFIYYNIEFPLYAVNTNYKYLNEYSVRMLFTAMPYINLTTISLLFIKRSVGILVQMFLCALYFVYYLTPIVHGDCAACMCAGFIPNISMEWQCLISGITLASAITAFLLYIPKKA